MKTYVANGITFKGKNEESDDLVSAMLLAVRMITVLGDWDPVVYNKIVEDARLEDFELPMPIHIQTF